MESKILPEGDYKFDFSKADSVVKADEPTVSGLKGVDFIVNMKDRILFVEVKDYENKKSNPIRKNKDLEMLRERKDFINDMAGKFKDTIIRCWGYKEDLDKPVEYIVLVQMHSLDAFSWGKLTEDLNAARLPKNINTKRGFKRTLEIKKAIVIDFEKWKEYYPDFPIKPKEN